MPTSARLPTRQNGVRLQALMAAPPRGRRSGRTGCRAARPSAVPPRRAPTVTPAVSATLNWCKPERSSHFGRASLDAIETIASRNGPGQLELDELALTCARLVERLLLALAQQANFARGTPRPSCKRSRLAPARERPERANPPRPQPGEHGLVVPCSAGQAAVSSGCGACVASRLASV